MRLTGALLLGAAWLFADGLARIMPLGIAEPVPTFALPLALLMFMAGTSGTMFLLLGAHLFDRVHISSRWVERTDDNRPPSVTMD